MITLIDIYDCYSTVTDFSVLFSFFFFLFLSISFFFFFFFFVFFVRRRAALVSTTFLAARPSLCETKEKERVASAIRVVRRKEHDSEDLEFSRVQQKTEEVDAAARLSIKSRLANGNGARFRSAEGSALGSRSPVEGGERFAKKKEKKKKEKEERKNREKDSQRRIARERVGGTAEEMDLL